jgi:hypothetical protein
MGKQAIKLYPPYYKTWSKHRLSINRPTKRGKENSRSDGHCQCEKEMDDYFTGVPINI